MNEILLVLIFSIGINLIMFVPAYLFQTDKLTDLSYAITFVVIALFAYLRTEATLATTLLLLMVCVWALRLGGYLFIRIRKMKRDKRFDEMRHNFAKFLRFWLLQGVSVAVIMVATVLAMDSDTKMLGLVSILGLVIWLKGLAIEALADLQKFRFNNQLGNKGKWINTGIWRYSRHPNYYGEILVWAGVYIFCVPYLSGGQLLIALLSPAYIIGLLLFVSGIPLLEKSAEERWGSNKAYQQYKKNTPVLIPKPKLALGRRTKVL